MLDYTKAALKKTVEDVKRVVFIYTIISLLLYTAYLVYASIVGIGNLYANVVLAVISLSYLVFYIVSEKKKLKKSSSKKIKRIYKWSKITVSAFTLGISIYGAFSNAASDVTIIITVFLFLGWVLQVLLEIISIIIENRIAFFTAALTKDFSPIMNVYNKITGRPEEEKEPSRHIEKLDKLVSESKTENKTEFKIDKTVLKREVASHIKSFVKSRLARKEAPKEEEKEEIKK